MRYLDVKNFMNLPDLDAETDEYTDFDDKVSLVVHDVQQNDDGLEHVEEHGSH